MGTIENFDGIFLNISKVSGKLRFVETGFGWKPSGGGETFTLDKSVITAAQWSKAAKGYEVKLLCRNSDIHQLDGFAEDALERLGKIFKNWYNVPLETKEHAIRGWNWGKTEFAKAELVFNVSNKPAFEIPYSEITNTNLAGRNEVAVEFTPPDPEDKSSSKDKAKSQRAGAGDDQLVEMRFYIPGQATVKGADGDNASRDGSEAEDVTNAASLFYETLADKAEVGDMAGDTIATFLDILHLTPRGRFDLDLYESSFRLRGKTYDYKLQYDAVKKFMVLPKPDDLHFLLVIGLEPPLRQGQTRYPFLVMQFKRDDEVTIELNLSEEDAKVKYEGRLQTKYEQPLYLVIATVFRGLANKKINAPAKGFLTHRHQPGIKCSIKASEGFLYCLEKAFMFVPKPATYIAYNHTRSVTFSRVGGAVSALSTFDITITMDGSGSFQFSNINREDLKSLEDFFKLKGLKVKNELDEEASILAQAMHDANMASSDEEVTNLAPTRGSADEDEESVDEDFEAESDSDVAEEYDSNHESEGGDSDANDDDDGDDGNNDDEDDDDEKELSPVPKKKQKTKPKK